MHSLIPFSLLKKLLRLYLSLIVLLVIGQEAVGQTVTMRGFVTDASSGQPLQGANVVLQGESEAFLGAVSSVEGIYQIGQIEPGQYVFQVSFIGFTTYVDTLNIGADPFLVRSVALEPASEELDDIVVEAEGGAASVEAGLQTIRPADIQRLPTPDASGDLATYLQSLPGVVSVGDRGGQLFIRGGTPSQNLVLMDGLVVYQPFHIIGFFSAFPEDIISNADLYAGGFGARYTGRISSVIDIKTRDGNIQKHQAAASVSPFLASVRVDGPLKKGASSFLASVRSSLIKQTGPTLVGEPLPFEFGDVFLKFLSAEGDRARCSLSSMFTYDLGRIDPERTTNNDIFRWRNFMLGGRCISLPTTSPVLFEVHGGLSRVLNEVGDPDSPERRSSSVLANTQIDLTRYFDTYELGWGLFVRMNFLNYALGEQYDNIENAEELLFGFGGYIEATFKAGDRFRITPGIAVTKYQDYPGTLEPRVRLLWAPGGEEGSTELSAAAGLYTQTLVGAMDERDAGSAFVAWLPAPVDNAQSRALHVITGVQQDLGSHLRFSAEGFYKRITSLAVPIWSSIARFTTTLDLAEGTVYGFDTRMEYQLAPLYGYVGYGYSWTEYEASQDQFQEWFGEPIQRYHPPHDRRHQLNIVASLDVGDFTMSARWQYGSGLPYTRPLGFDELIVLRDVVDVTRNFGTTRVLYDRPYEGRLPDYHRLDLTLDRVFDTQWGDLTAQVGTINLYDRANLFYYDVFTVRRVDQLPIIPVLSLKLEIE